jgi:protein-tyrosine phosphatase
MIDTHNHILDHMDDGPSKREETLEMCRIAQEEGIGTIVATPHAFDGRFVIHPDKIRAAVADLNGELSASGIDVKIMSGMEVRVSADLFQSLTNGQLLPLNGRTHLLVEFHPQHIPAGFENLVRHFEGLGFSIILAHPEKNLLIQRNPSYIFSLLERFAPWKVLIQITADSLTGESGFWAMRTARLLLRCGLAHLIATDAHSATRRPPRLARAVERAAKIVGKERAAMMVHDIPLAVLEGESFPESWDRTEPRAWWRIFG